MSNTREVDEERNMTPRERLEFYKTRKLQKRREQKLASYNKNKTINRTEYKDTPEAVRKRLYRAKRAEMREKETKRKRNYRKSLKDRNITVSTNSKNVTEMMKDVFKNRTSKHRALKRLKDALPQTPKQRSATLAAYLKNSKSPTTKILIDADVISSPEEQNEKSTEKAVLRDIKTAIDSSKMKRSKDSITSMNVLVASVSGEQVTKSRCRKNLAKSLGLPIRRISKGNRIRTTVLKSEKSCWTYTTRKTRSDAISKETKRLAYDFWLRPGISRPTGNKADIKRERLGPKTYTSHAVHILEKSQTEVFVDFICENPNIKISQRSFENCKPYFVRQARSKDRHTCCCRYHVEIKSAFKSCMDFRKKIFHTNENYVGNEATVYESISDIMNATLCSNYELKCLRRNCAKCGIHRLHLLPEENGNAETEETVKWEKFEKVDIKVKGNKTIKKLVLVKKESKVSDLFSHLLHLLISFPLHQHRATWQHSQFKTLVSNLPIHHCVCVHDFSENYRCTELKQLQSSYFQKTEVSIHVTIIHRHALLEIDGVESSEDNPEIITEHFFVISNDQQHDQYFVHEVRKSLSEYLSSISYPVETMHEFTDGCAAQYKSRHCFGDISNSCRDFGFKHFTRNYFETAHAKGPQDAAGGLLKRQADLAVLRGQAHIQNGQDLYEFAIANLTRTKSVCRKRIFRFLDSIPRECNLQFKPVSNIRSVHQVIVDNSSSQIITRELSCFCEKCESQTFDDCPNVSKAGQFVGIKMINETGATDVESDNEEESLSELVSKGHVIAVYTDDPDHDYYLLKVDEPVHILDSEKTDSWGSTLPAGTEVITGLYYDNIKQNPLSYKLVSRKRAVIPASAVIYICSELTASSKIALDEEVHLNILHAINEITCSL